MIAGSKLIFKQRKWMFDRSELQRGDVLFTRSKFLGTGIAKATKGQFGHVMLYLGGTIMHADMKGVWSKNPDRILVNDQSRLAAYRLRITLADALLQRIESFARSRVGSLYSIPQAVKSVQKPTRSTTDSLLLSRQFCSRLVAQCFAEAGVRLVDDINYCTPNDIASSDLLYEIPNAVKVASADEINFCNTPDFNQEIQAETFKWLDKVRALSENHQLRPVYTQSDVTQWIVDYPHFDELVCKFIQDSKYLSLYDADRVNNPWRYDKWLMLVMLKSRPNSIEFLENEHRINLSVLERLHGERLIAIENSKTGLLYFKLEEQLLTKRLALIHLWKGAVEHAKLVIGSQQSND